MHTQSKKEANRDTQTGIDTGEGVGVHMHTQQREIQNHAEERKDREKCNTALKETVKSWQNDTDTPQCTLIHSKQKCTQHGTCCTSSQRDLRVHEKRNHIQPAELCNLQII